MAELLWLLLISWASFSLINSISTLNYVEVVLHIDPSDDKVEWLNAELFAAGAEGVWEDESAVKAYIPVEVFTKQFMEELLSRIPDLSNIEWTASELPDINWNEEWEKNYPIAVINEKCRIIGPFHERDSSIKHDILVAPKMAFGTGHHATTTMMLRAMMARESAFRRSEVADVGCGTGVLAIMAERLGASHVLAVDYDPWSVENTQENIGLNQCERITVQHGESGALQGKQFGVILANINRNILLNQIPDYAASSPKNGLLFLSGFMQGDIDTLIKVAGDQGYSFEDQSDMNEWRCLIFKKI